MTKHVVMFSGGVGSWAAAKRVAEQYDVGNLYLLFADVNGEDEDCYRFIGDAALNIGGQLIWLDNDGRTIWDVFKQKRMLGNTRIANCSHLLKQEPARRWLRENTDPDDTVVYVGIDWSEIHRVDAIKRNYAPWRAEAPMTEPPYLDKDDMLAWCRDEGLEPPRMYAEGFPHANCAGGCVKAGQGQFKLLLEQRPEVYAEWERNEQDMRDYLGKNVAILRDRSIEGNNAHCDALGLSRTVAEQVPNDYGVDTITGDEVVLTWKTQHVRRFNAVPLPLSVLRQRIEQTPEQVDADEIGGCGCFVDE